MGTRMDRLEELRLFLAIVDTGSFAAGGRRCGRSPSSATRILSEMEQRLGILLLQRTTRKLSLTDGGARLADQARRLLADFDEAMHYAIGEPTALSGRIRLSAPLFFGRRYFAALVNDFLDLHPEITAELSLEDRLVDLIDERVDLALRIGHLNDSSFISRMVGEVSRIVVASPDYLTKNSSPRKPADLARHQAILFINHANGPGWKFIEKDKSEVVIKMNGRFQVDRAEIAIQLARQGKGLARILSYQVASELQSGALVIVLKRYQTPPLPVQLVYPSARLLAPRVRAFIDFASARLSQLPELT